MQTFDRYASLIVWMLCLLGIVVFIMLVRGPVRQAAWDEPCRVLRSGGAIPGTWNTIQPCNDIRSTS